MIPLSSNASIVHEDKKSGVKYKLRFLTDSALQAEYLLVTQEERKQLEKFEQQAAAELPQPKGFDAKDKKQAETRERALLIRGYALLAEDRQKNPTQYVRTMDSYINIFLGGWEGCEEPFPKDRKPAAMFTLFQKMEMYRAIQDHIGTLTGLTVDESKN